MEPTLIRDRPRRLRLLGELDRGRGPCGVPRRRGGPQGEPARGAAGRTPAKFRM